MCMIECSSVYMEEDGEPLFISVINDEKGKRQQNELFLFRSEEPGSLFCCGSILVLPLEATSVSAVFDMVFLSPQKKFKI